MAEKAKTVVIAIVNQKGGVGKTTAAVNISGALADKGNRVLLIDADPQANATITLLNVDDEETDLDNYIHQNNIYHVLIKEKKLADVIMHTEVKNLDIAPSSITLATAEIQLQSQFKLDFQYRLADPIDTVKDQYDYVIIDCPPTLGTITMNALVAATHILIPLGADKYSIKGTYDLMVTIAEAQTSPRINPHLQVLGVFINNFENTKVSNRALETVQECYGEDVYIFKTKISKSVKLKEAPACGKTIFQHFPNGPSAEQFTALTEEVLQRVRERES